MSYIKRQIEDMYTDILNGMSTEDIKEKYHCATEDVYDVITIFEDKEEP